MSQYAIRPVCLPYIGGSLAADRSANQSDWSKRKSESLRQRLVRCAGPSILAQKPSLFGAGKMQNARKDDNC